MKHELVMPASVNKTTFSCKPCPASQQQRLLLNPPEWVLWKHVFPIVLCSGGVFLHRHRYYIIMAHTLLNVRRIHRISDASSIDVNVDMDTIPVSVKNTPFRWTSALQARGRNRSPAPDLALWRRVFPRVCFSRGVFFSQTPVLQHKVRLWYNANRDASQTLVWSVRNESWGQGCLQLFV